MVKLTFSTTLPLPLSVAWSFFYDFRNIAEWDPNVKSVKMVQKTQKPNKIGQKYHIVSNFRGNESEIDYQITEYQQEKLIKLVGKNSMVYSEDIMQFKRISQNKTQVNYYAQFKLQSFYKLFTPLIYSDLKKLQVSCREGMERRAQQLAKQYQNKQI